MSNIRLMKLAGLLTESTKKKITESVDDFVITSPIELWDFEQIGPPNLFKISEDYFLIGMEDDPKMLSDKEINDALADCDKNMQRVKMMAEMVKKAKEQLQTYIDSAKKISAGEKEYANRQITPKHVLDFLESIFITDTDNAKKIYNMYNGYIKTEMGKYKNIDINDYLLKSPSDLVGRGRIKGKDDVRFEFKRQSGGLISENAFFSSVIKFVKQNYPEVAEHLILPPGSLYKKNFTIRVKRSSMASAPARNRAWQRIFIKYAEWLED